MKKILVGIPTIRDFAPFWKSLGDFYANAVEFYNMDMMVVSGKRLGMAQNNIADLFMQGKWDYLLFLDDDQWGHTIQMLDCLVNADSMVAVIKTYSRHYPHLCTLLNYTNEKGMVASIENGEGYMPCDVAGFPMTLIKREVFNLLDKPYFREIDSCGRDWNTDVDFCERLAKLGIKPTGCFQYCLNHDIVTQDNVKELRYKGCRDQRKMAMFKAFNIQQEILRGVK